MCQRPKACRGTRTHGWSQVPWLIWYIATCWQLHHTSHLLAMQPWEVNRELRCRWQETAAAQRWWQKQSLIPKESECFLRLSCTSQCPLLCAGPEPFVGEKQPSAVISSCLSGSKEVSSCCSQNEYFPTYSVFVACTCLCNLHVEGLNYCTQGWVCKAMHRIPWDILSAMFIIHRFKPFKPFTLPHD